jgi:hypothetical protein
VPELLHVPASGNLLLVKQPLTHSMRFWGRCRHNTQEVSGTLDTLAWCVEVQLPTPAPNDLQLPPRLTCYRHHHHALDLDSAGLAAAAAAVLLLLKNGPPEVCGRGVLLSH